MSPSPGEIRGVQLLQSVLARAVEDDELRRRLHEDPKTVLREAGLQIADDVEVVVHENASNRVNLVLPSRPQRWEELDVEEVDAVLLLECPF